MGATEREPLLYIAVGRRGVGKTHKSKEMIDTYVSGIPSQGIKPRKVLVFDVNMEYTDGYKALRLEDVKRFTYHPKREKRRVLPMREDGSVMGSLDMIDALEEMLTEFRGGLFVVEDIKLYVSDNISRDIYGKLVTTRHRDCDLLMHVQGINVIKNPKLFPNINILRIHKYSGTVDDYKKSWGEHYSCLKICETLVNTKYGLAAKQISEGKIKDKIKQKQALSFHVYYNLDNYTISGDFTKDDFKEAIEEFVFDNSDLTVNKYMRKKDRKTGKDLYTYEQAFKAVEDEMFLNHYGNKK